MSMLDASNFVRLTRQLKQHEGTQRDAQGRHMAYRCTAGALTIGYGHNLDAGPVPGIGKKSRLTEEQACVLLSNDVNAVEHRLRGALPFVHSLDPVRYAVLVNMAFNMGLHTLLTFENTLRHIEQGEYAEAAHNMLQSKWAGQVGRRAWELAQQMRTGEWAKPWERWG